MLFLFLLQANSYVDMTRIRMDPVNVRMDEISATKQELIRWVEGYCGPVALYTKVNLANKIKLILPDTGQKSIHFLGLIY